MPEQKKKGFFKRNKEKIKMGAIIGTSVGTIGGVAGLITAHIVNPALAFVTIPIALQAILALIIKKAPKNFPELRKIVDDVLKDEPEDVKEKFAEDIASNYSTKMPTFRSTTEPIQTPSEVEDVVLPARYHKRSGTYDIYTPRPAPK